MAHGGQRGTVGDMVRSLLIILIPVIAITWFFTRTPEVKPERVDFSATLSEARAAAPYPVLAPVSLPPEWIPNRVSWVATGDALGESSWQLGVLSPDQIYFEVRQVAGSSVALIEQETRQGSQDGQSTVDGQTWQRYVSADGRTRALVLQTAKATTVVSADDTYAALDAYAATLRSS